MNKRCGSEPFACAAAVLYIIYKYSITIHLYIITRTHWITLPQNVEAFNLLHLATFVVDSLQELFIKPISTSGFLHLAFTQNNRPSTFLAMARTGKYSKNPSELVSKVAVFGR